MGKQNRAEESKQDWFYGRLSGDVSGNYSDILNTNSVDNFTIGKPEDYLKNPKITEYYKGKFGDDYKDALKKDIIVAQKDYQSFVQGDFDNYSFSKTVLGPGMGWLSESGKYKEIVSLPSFYATPARLDKAFTSISGDITESGIDSRQFDAKSGVYFDSEGNEYKMPTKKEATKKYDPVKVKLFQASQNNNPITGVVDKINASLRVIQTAFTDDDDSGMAYMVNNPDYKIDGKLITGWVYQAGDLGGARKPGYVAVTEGNYLKHAGQTPVSVWDAYHGDFDREAGAFDFLGRTLNNSVNALPGMVYTTASAVDGIWNGNKALNRWEKELMMNRMNEVSLSKASEEAGFLGNWDQTAGLVTDVVAQMLTGRVVGGLAFKGTSLLLKAGNLSKITALTSEQVISKAATAAKWSSLGTMSIYGAKDAYHGALANGFSNREAGFLFLGTFGALMGANKYINVLENAWTNKQSAAIIGDMINAEVNANKEVLKSIAKEAVEGTEQAVTEAAKRKVLGTYLSKTADVLNIPFKLFKKALDPVVKVGKTLSAKDTFIQKTLGGAINESTEESLEFLGEESVKNIFSFLKWSTGWEGEDGRDGKMKNMFSPGYWEEFGTGLFQSAAGGAMGGALMKTRLFKNLLNADDGHTKLKDNLVSVVENGLGDKYLAELKDKRDRGELGSTKLSTILDPVSQTYVPIENTDIEGAVSMNEAMYQVLKQQYHYVDTLLNQLGSKAVIEKFKEKYPDLLYNTSLAKDINSLHKEYIDIVVNNNIDPQARPTENLYITPKDTPEEVKAKVEKYAGVAGVNEDVAKRLLEINSEIKNIETGKTVRKYLLQGISGNSILNPNNKVDEHLQEHKVVFGDNVLDNLMQESKGKFNSAIENLKVNLQKQKDTDKLINSLKGDLSNIDDLESLLNDPDTFASAESKLRLANLLKDEKSSAVILKDIKESLKKEAKELYTEDYIRNSFAFSKESKNLDDQQKENYIAYASAALQNFAENQIDKLSNLDDILNYNLLDFNKLHYISKIQENLVVDDYDPDVLTIKPFEEISKSTDRDEVVKAGENLGRIASNQTDSLKSDILKSNIQEIKNLSKLQDILNKINSAQELNEEKGYIDALVQSLSTGFDGDNTEINNTSDLEGLIKNLIDVEARSNPATDPFRNVDEANYLSYQSKARLAQVSIIINSLFDNFTALDESGSIKTFLTKIKGSNEGIISDFYHAISDLVSSEDLDTESDKFFPDIELRAKEYFDLYKKGKKRTKEDNAKFDELKSNNIGALLALKEKLLILTSQSEILVEKANQGAKLAEDADVHKKTMIDEMIKDEKVMSSLVSILEAINPEIAELPVIADYKEQLIANSSKFSNNENIKKSFKLLEDVKSILYKLDNTTKDKILGDYLNFEKIQDGSLEPAEQSLWLEKYRRAIVFLKLNYYDYYKAAAMLMETEPDRFGETTGQQDLSILSLVAHLTTDSAAAFTAVTEIKGENKLHNATVLLGIQGSGKSSYVLGTALRIAEIMKGLDGSKPNVLIASNQPEQVKILESETSKFGVKVVNKDLTSEEDKGKLTPKKLLKLLSDPNNLTGIDTIVYDEATYIQFDPLTVRGAETIPFDKRSDLNKILDSIDAINKLRAAKGQAPLKLILMGDDKQNGFRGENGAPKHIKEAGKFFKSPKLMYNLRSAVKSMNSFVRKEILNLDENDRVIARGTSDLYSIDTLHSVWGNIVGMANFLGGIRFESRSIKDRAQSFDDEFFDNVRTQIEDHESANLEKFTLGVILPSLKDADDIDPNSKLGKLITDYPNNIKVTSHDTVQGQEFDYVFSIVTSNDIGDGRNAWSSEGFVREEAAGIKLGTTIGRAKFFAYVVNETNRKFSSDSLKDSIRVTDALLSENLINGYVELKKEMYNSVLSGEDKASEAASIITAAAEKTPSTETTEQAAKEEERLKEEKIKDAWYDETVNLFKNVIKKGDKISFYWWKDENNNGTVEGTVEVEFDGVKLLYKLDSGINSGLVIDRNSMKLYDTFKTTYIEINDFKVIREEDQEINLPAVEDTSFSILEEEAVKQTLRSMDDAEFEDLLDIVRRIVDNDPSVTPEQKSEVIQKYDTHGNLYQLLFDIEKSRSRALNNYTTGDVYKDLKLKAIFKYLRGMINTTAYEILNSKNRDNFIFEDNYGKYTEAEAKEKLDIIANELEWDGSGSSIDGFSYREIYSKVNEEFDNQLKELRPEKTVEVIKEDEENIEPVITANEEPVVSDVSVEDQTNILNITEEEFESGKITEEELKEEQEKLASSIAQQEILADEETELSDQETMDSINSTYGPEFPEAFSNEFFEGVIDEADKNKKLVPETKSKFVKTLEKEGLDTFYANYAPNIVRQGVAKAKDLFDKMVEISKDYVNYVFGEANQSDANSLQLDDYIAKQIAALGLSRDIPTSRFDYELSVFHKPEETEVGYSTNILITAVDKSSGIRIQVGRILYEFLDAETKEKYSKLFSEVDNQNWEFLERRETLNKPLTIKLPFDALSLENITPGGIEAATQNVEYTEDFKLQLEANHPGLKLSPIMISTSTTIEKEGKLIENPFRGEGFVLYSFGNKIDLTNEIDLSTILNKGLALADKNLNHTFANGIGIIRLDNRYLFLDELIKDLGGSSITHKEITNAINIPKTQRDLSALFVNLLLSNPELFNKLDKRLQENLNKYQQQSTYKTFKLDGSLKEESIYIYNGTHLTKKSISMTNEELQAQKLANDFLEHVFINPIEALDNSKGLVLGSAKTIEDETGEREIVYKTAIDRVTRRSYSYPEMEKSSAGSSFVMKILPVTDSDTTDKKPNAQFNLENLLVLMKEFVENSGQPENVKTKFYDLFQDIFKSTAAGTLKNGVAIRPRIEKIKNVERKLFARAAVKMDKNTLSYYNIKVSSLSFPQLIVDRERLINSVREDIQNERNNEINSQSKQQDIDKNDNRLSEIQQEINNLEITKDDKQEYLKELESLEGSVTNTSLMSNLKLQLNKMKFRKSATPSKAAAKVKQKNEVLNSIESPELKNLVDNIEADKNIFLGIDATNSLIEELNTLKAELSSIPEIIGNDIERRRQSGLKIIFAAPTSGKTTALKNGADIIDFDTWLSKDLKALYNANKKDTETIQQYKAKMPVELQEFYDKKWNEALSQDKTILVSQAYILNKYKDQFDAVYLVDKDEMKKRLQDRGSYKEQDFEDWYNNIQRAAKDKVTKILKEGEFIDAELTALNTNDANIIEGKIKELKKHLAILSNPETFNEYINSLFDKNIFNAGSIKTLGLNVDANTNLGTADLNPSLSYNLLFLAYHQAKANNDLNAEYIKSLILEKAQNNIPDTYQAPDLSEGDVAKIQQATSTANISDTIEDEELQNTINSTLDSIKNIPSLRIESPSDIDSSRVNLQNAVNKLMKIAENVVDAGQREQLISEIKTSQEEVLNILNEKSESLNNLNLGNDLFPGDLAKIDEDNKDIITNLINSNKLSKEAYIEYLNSDDSNDIIEELFVESGLNENTIDAIANYKYKC
jgi:hypothetical protein